MRYVITEQGPRGTDAAIAEAEDFDLASQIFDLAAASAPGPGWRYRLHRDGDLVTERTSA